MECSSPDAHPLDACGRRRSRTHPAIHHHLSKHRPHLARTPVTAMGEAFLEKISQRERPGRWKEPANSCMSACRTSSLSRRKQDSRRNPAHLALVARTPVNKTGRLTPPRKLKPKNRKPRLRPFRPAGQIFFLFGRQAIDFDAHRLQFQLGHALV